MFEYIENSNVILDEIGADNPFHFSDIMKIEYSIDVYKRQVIDTVFRFILLQDFPSFFQ
nr:hypothetical protein A5881_002014 [Enterococcus termitis]